MASLKFKIKTKPKSNGLHSIHLQILKDRKVKIITTGLEVPKELWDKPQGCFKSRHSNATMNNQLLDKLKIRGRNIISEFGMDGMDFSLDEFENQFRVNPSKQNAGLFKFWKTVINDMEKVGRMGNAKVNRDTLKSLKKFTLKKEINIKEVSVNFLDKYELFLRSKGGTDGGIGVKMRAIRATFNLAIRRGLVRASFYPFKDYKISKLRGRKVKQALTIEEVKSFKKIDCNGSRNLINAKNYFLFSFYNRGMNFADMMLLKWSDVSTDRVQYIRVKTKGRFSIKIVEPVAKILKFYKSNDNGTKYVFPILLHNDLSFKQIANRKHKILSQYNSDLKILATKAGINKHMTSYVARHSFAMCLREKGIGIDLIGESLGHQNVTTTKAYVEEFGVDVLDNAVNVLM